MKTLIENLKPTIGIEIHAELRTASKMFCGCPANHFGIKPNSLTCPVCLGLPGALPVPNKQAVEWTILIGLALNCRVNPHSKFDRKHYFYPDLPKGYQISQYDEPLCSNGFVITSEGKVRITRVHLEEDTGKLLHTRLNGKSVTLVDFNRSGVPLVEIVSEPDLKSARQAKEFTQKIQRMIRYLKVSDCDMEKGSLRLEANVSLGTHLGYKVEVKNLNSFRFVERAIDYELERQKGIIAKRKLPKQETRGFNQAKNLTVPQRQKETAADYRYFPEPDIPPMTFTSDYVTAIRRQLPQLPEVRAEKFTNTYGVRQHYAELLVTDRKLADYAHRVFEIARRQAVKPDEIAGAIVNRKIEIHKLSPQQAVDRFKAKNVRRLTDVDSLSPLIDSAIDDSPQAVMDYKNGKTGAIAVLIGNVMQRSGGKADPTLVRKILEERLNQST